MSRRVGLGFGPLGSGIRRPLVVAFRELGLAHVVQHVLDQLLGSSRIATGSDAWSKSLDHVPHSREVRVVNTASRNAASPLLGWTWRTISRPSTQAWADNPGWLRRSSRLGLHTER